MKKFLLRLFLFCAIPMPLLVLLDHVVDEGLHKSRYLYYSDWSDLFGGRINADMLIFGTSRAFKHVSPAIIDTILHVNSYNLGMDGASFDIQDDIFRLYLQHNEKPKYILQEVSYPTFVKSDSDQYYHEFISYIGDSAVRAILKRHYASLGIAEEYFPLYKYNGDLPAIKEGLMSYAGHGHADIKYKGYQAMDQPWDSTFYLFKKNYPNGRSMPVDSSVVVAFNQYLDHCKASGIKVIVFYPPTYYESIPYILNHEQMHRMFKDIAAAHGTPFLDYTRDSINYNRSYFYNSQHLNKAGSEIFSKKLANDIKQLLNNAI